MLHRFICVVLGSMACACSLIPMQAHFDAAASQAQLYASLRAHPLILLGEVHDNAQQHALRAKALADYLQGGARPALLMEQFDRNTQPAIDAAMARADVTADEIIAIGQGTGWDWPLYRPYIELAIRYHLPLIAANVSRAETRAIISQGLGPSGFAAEIPDDILRQQTDEIIAAHCGLLGAAQAARMVPAQIARDQFMAQMIQAHRKHGVILLAGNGHVRKDIGVPRWLDAASQTEAYSIGLLESGTESMRKHFDLALLTLAQERPDPCAELKPPQQK